MDGFHLRYISFEKAQAHHELTSRFKHSLNRQVFVTLGRTQASKRYVFRSHILSPDNAHSGFCEASVAMPILEIKREENPPSASYLTVQ